VVLPSHILVVHPLVPPHKPQTERSVEKLFTNYGTWADGEGRKRDGRRVIQSVVCDLENVDCDLARLCLYCQPTANHHKPPGR